MEKASLHLAPVEGFKSEDRDSAFKQEAVLAATALAGAALLIASRGRLTQALAGAGENSLGKATGSVMRMEGEYASTGNQLQSSLNLNRESLQAKAHAQLEELRPLDKTIREEAALKYKAMEEAGFPLKSPG